MKKILSKPITISVFREGESPIYSENAFHITVSDLAAGEFLEIKQLSDGQSISVGFDEIDALFYAANKLTNDYKDSDGN